MTAENHKHQKGYVDNLHREAHMVTRAVALEADGDAEESDSGEVNEEPEDVVEF